MSVNTVHSLLKALDGDAIGGSFEYFGTQGYHCIAATKLK